MSSADDGEPSSDRRGADPASSHIENAETLLVEALIHVLMEKGVLTKNDALSIVETAAQVRLGKLEERGGASSGGDIAMRLLRRMFSSLETLPERVGDIRSESDNVVPLRRSVHGEHPEFPQDE